MRAGTFETGVQSAENYGKIFEQAYGRGYRGRSSGFTEDYEDSQKDIVANSFRLRAAQEESKAHQYAAAADYLKTIEAQQIESRGGIQEQKIKGQFDLAGSQVEGQYSLAKQDIANRGIMEKTLVDNEYDNVREQWKIKDNQYRAQLQEQGLNQRAVFDKEMARVLKGMEIEGNLKSTIIGKQFDHETAMAREGIQSQDRQMQMAKDLYDNPETQHAWVEFQKAMQKGDYDKASKIYAVGKLYAPNVRQEASQDKKAKEMLDFQYRMQQDELGQLNKDREFGLAFKKENREALTQISANYINYQDLLGKMDKAWNEKINDPMLKPEERQALVNDSKFVGPAIQAIQAMATAQSPEQAEQARQALTKYVSQASPQGKLYIQQRAKIGSLLANAEKELYTAYGLNLPQDPDMIDDAQEEEPSRIGGAIKGIVGFIHGAITAPIQTVLDYYSNDFYATEPQNVDIVANQLLRAQLRGQGFRGKLLDQEANKRFQSMEQKDKIKSIRDNVSAIEKLKAATDARAQANPAANFDTETNRDLAIGLLALAGGGLIGKGAGVLARGALRNGVKAPSGQALLSRLTGYFSKREKEVLAPLGQGFTPWGLGEPQIPSRAGSLAGEALPQGPGVFRPGITNQPAPFPASYGPYQPAPFPAQTGPYQPAPFPVPAQTLTKQALTQKGNPIFQNATGSYTNTSPSFVEAPSKTWPTAQPSFLPKPKTSLPDTIHKVNTGVKVPPKQAKFTMNELKENPQVAYEIPDVQTAIQAGMQPDEAVAQWTTKMLQNVG